MFEGVAPWQWWILAAVVAAWFVYAVLVARGAAPDISLSDGNLNRLINDHDKALLLINTGDFSDAEATLTEALERMPPLAECTEVEADLAHLMVEILIRPDVSAAGALDLIWKSLERKERESVDRPLSPLPPEIANDAAAAYDTEVSEQEFLLFEAQAEALAKSGRNEKLETLTRAMLARHTRRTIIRGNLLHILARALVRAGWLGSANDLLKRSVRSPSSR
jgi:hypothetical protein